MNSQQVQFLPHSIYSHNIMTSFIRYWILKWDLRDIGYRLTKVDDLMNPFKVDNMYHPYDTACYSTLEQIRYDFGL